MIESMTSASFWGRSQESRTAKKEKKKKIAAKYTCCIAIHETANLQNSYFPYSYNLKSGKYHVGTLYALHGQR